MPNIPSPDWDDSLDEDDVPHTPGSFNIRTKDGHIFLAEDCERASAEHWLEHYRGYYPDFGFHLVELDASNAYVPADLELVAA